ncbi:MAG TPA: DUF1343 domain-containing protein [Thermoanaerobaculia bacterium]|nr:DUF1343 domain-containing protein [Thermoanaerobaculia bacterium]
MKLGIDVLLAAHRDRLRGARLGLLTNYASFTSGGVRNIDALLEVGGWKSLTIFGPEHGYWGAVQYMEPDHDEAYREVPIRSLYDGDSGYSMFPQPKEIAELDLLLVDLQDIGARYYTFYASMANCMEVAAGAGVEVWVLDRPNPLNGNEMEGNLLRPPFIAFVGQYPIPNRHGMTIGELAIFLNRQIGCKLEVVGMQGWRRSMWWDETGLPWTHPSPNIPTLDTTIVYPGMAFLEGTNLSEGRGTTRPFELFGAPWLDPFRLSDALNDLGMPGVRFDPFYAIPTFHKHANQRCGMARITVTDRKAFKPVRTGLWCIKVARDLDPKRFGWYRKMYEWANCAAIDALAGTIALRTAIDLEQDFAEFVDAYDASARFEKVELAQYSDAGPRLHVPGRADRAGVAIPESTA